VRQLVVPLAVAAALAVVFGLTSFGHQAVLGAGRQVQSPGSAAVTSAVRVCPSPGTSGSAGAAVALVAAPATAGSGQAQITRLGGSATAAPLSRLTRPETLSVTPVRPAPNPPKQPAGGTPTQPAASATTQPAAKATKQPGATATRPAAPPSGPPVPTANALGGVVVQATGSMARGLAVEQVAGGIPAGQCTGPGTDFWFVGPGQHDAGRIQLFLMNTGNQTADVNVAVATDAGPLQGTIDSGISVAPGSMVVQSLGAVLRGSRVLALHVRTSVGQVVAAVQESTGGGSGAWLPAVQPPATRVVLPGLPAVAGTRELFVSVPGTQDAHIRLTAVTTKGSYQPIGGSGIDVPGGSAFSVPLPALAGIPAAITLSANVPVVASAMLSGGPAGAPGVFTAASPPMTQQGIAAYNRSGAGMASELVLSAPGRAVQVRVTQIGSAGAAAAPQIVQIRAGYSVVTQIGRAGGAGHAAPFAVMITPLPGSGPLYAGQVITSSGTGGSVQSLLPVTSAPTKVPLPQLRNEIITMLP
jgi:hypothetical protein